MFDIGLDGDGNQIYKTNLVNCFQVISLSGVNRYCVDGHLHFFLPVSDLTSESNSSGCQDVSIYREEISRLKREFEDIQKMILGQEQVWI